MRWYAHAIIATMWGLVSLRWFVGHHPLGAWLWAGLATTQSIVTVFSFVDDRHRRVVDLASDLDRLEPLSTPELHALRARIKRITPTTPNIRRLRCMLAIDRIDQAIERQANARAR